MNPYIRRIGTAIIQSGIHPRRILASLRFLPRYLLGALHVSQELKRSKAPFRFHLLPALSDRDSNSGIAAGHYFHQDLWAARRVYSRRPDRHVDIGSRVDGFIAHLLTFRDVEVLDIRELSSKVPGLRFRQADLMQSAGDNVASTDSLSCLHALEHFGLGRYGDPIDIDGWRKGLLHLSQMLVPGGHLYLSVPIGPQAVEFNAHRIFDPRTIVDAGKAVGLELLTFSFVDDGGDFYENHSVDDALLCEYGCGCFEFVLLRKR